jgi:hypothetical protein
VKSKVPLEWLVLLVFLILKCWANKKILNNSLETILNAKRDKFIDYL